MSNQTLSIAGIALAVAVLVFTGEQPRAAPDAQDTPDLATVITLTQIPCQFVEAEGQDHGYNSASAEDCRTINADTGAARLQASEPLRLKPGKYVFRVTNKNVPYTLGFWLRGDGIIARARLPGVSSGGLKTGVSKDYEIELKPGEYIYSCPLNPTPDYKIVVAE